MEDEYLSLGIKKLEIEWTKNAIGKQDHSVLFNQKDKTSIPYHYENPDTGRITSRGGPGYRKQLSDVRERLDLLGFSFKNLPNLLKDYFDSFPNEHPSLAKIDTAKFIDILSKVDAAAVGWVDHEGDADLGEFFERRILTLPQFNALKEYLKDFKNVEQYVFEQIDPYIILAALAHNSMNSALTIEWRNDQKLTEAPDTYQKYLIVTEGVTDSEVLRKAFEILRPNIADFFEFIDMDKNYPFGGAGSLSNFFKGLAKIGTSRAMVFIFDNDAEGHGSLNKLKNVTHPSNMKKFAMPDMPEFGSFNTIGPTGTVLQDVNGRAVAIEMFLDLKYKSTKTPVVRWSSFDKNANNYQGALEDKYDYYEIFMNLKTQDYKNYNFILLTKFLNELVKAIIT
jgi:hypothetical protein